MLVIWDGRIVNYDVIGMVWWWTVRVGFPHATIIPWVTLWWVQLVGYILACRSHRLSVQYTISLSSSCKLIWRHWTYKMPVRYILSSVWVRLSLFSQLSFIQYVGLCVFSLPVSLMTNERMYILIIIIKSKVWTIIHCLGLGHSPGAKMGTWKCLRVQGFMIDPDSIGVLKEIKLGCHDGNLGELFLFA